MDVASPNTILEKFECELEILKSQSIEKRMFAEKSIGICQLAFLDLKSYVTLHGFKNKDEEIKFFKTVKPKVFGNLIYYNELLRIETYKPFVSSKLMIKTLKKEMRKINDFIKSNKGFYQYYITNQTCLDNTYFVRNNNFALINSKNLHYLTDPQFATLRDESVSYIIAYEQLGNYLENEIRLLKCKCNLWQPFQNKNLNIKMNWTAPKAALIELIYALHSSNCINNGRVDIKELIKHFEFMFDVKLDKSYRVFIDIKSRQRERTKFLIELQRALLKRLDDLDELN